MIKKYFDTVDRRNLKSITYSLWEQIHLPIKCSSTFVYTYVYDNVFNIIKNGGKGLFRIANVGLVINLVTNFIFQITLYTDTIKI